jgi:hypothetical protein
MTQQGDRQASVRAVTGTALTYEGDWHALFDAAGVAAGTFDGRLLAWINQKLSTSYANLPQAQQALAVANGAANFSSMGTFNAGGFPAPDFIIASDADWPTVTAAIIASPLTRQIEVGVMPGTYTAPLISGVKPVGGVRFRPISGQPVLDQLAIVNSALPNAPITLESLALVSSSWSATPAACVRLGGTVGALTVHNCDITGNYRGTVGYPFDPTDIGGNPLNNRYPELASIMPTVTGGVITALTVSRQNTGDLMADGTYNLVFTGGTGAAGTMTVSGGVITAATPTAGGSGYPSTGLGTVITWAGQHRLYDYMPYGIQRLTQGAEGASVLNGLITVQGNRFKLLHNGVKLNASTVGIIIDSNDYELIYEDSNSIGPPDATTTTSPYLVVTFNRTTRSFAQAGDAGDPHSDAIVQVFGQGGALTTDYLIDIYGNAYWHGNARGGSQAIFLRNEGLSYDFRARTIGVVGNIVLNQDLTAGIYVDSSTWLPVYGNTIARWDTSNTLNVSSVAITVGANVANIGTFVGGNIAEAYGGTGSANVDSTSIPNVTLGLNGVTIPYSSAFTSPNTAHSAISDVVADYLSKSPYQAKGASRSDGMVDFVNRTIDLSKVPTWAVIPAQTGVAISTLTNSAWSFMAGGPASFTITPDAGLEFQTADDLSGTNASAWFSTAQTGAFRGKAIRVRLTSSSSGNTAISKNITLNTTAWPFSVTTVSTAYPLVNNSGAAYSLISAAPASEANRQRMVLALEWQRNSTTLNKGILGSGTSGSTFHLMSITGPVDRFQFSSSAVCQVQGPTTTTNLNRDIFLLDTTQATNTDRIVWLRNGVRQTFTGTPVYPALNAVFNPSTVFATMTVAAEGISAGSPVNLYDGKIAFLFVDWGDNTFTMPDISTAQKCLDLNAAFAYSAINTTNGSGPLGHQPKLFFQSDTAAAWNSGLAGKGTAALTLNKQAGTYA